VQGTACRNAEISTRSGLWATARLEGADWPFLDVAARLAAPVSMSCCVGLSRRWALARVPAHEDVAGQEMPPGAGALGRYRFGEQRITGRMHDGLQHHLLAHRAARHDGIQARLNQSVRAADPVSRLGRPR
jgi:hypothetical protein